MGAVRAVGGSGTFSRFVVLTKKTLFIGYLGDFILSGPL